MTIRERILATSTELFMKFGIRSVTMDEIAKELGISKKTIYQNFADKDAIVHEITVFKMAVEQNECRKIYENSENPIEEFLQELLSLRKHEAIVNPTVVYDLKKYYPASWDLFKQQKELFFRAIVKRNLQDGIAQGLYRKEIDVEILSKLRMEQIDFAFDQNIFPHKEFNQFSIQWTFIDHFLRGIMTPKGLEIYEKYLQSAKYNYKLLSEI